MIVAHVKLIEVNKLRVRKMLDHIVRNIQSLKAIDLTVFRKNLLQTVVLHFKHFQMLGHIRQRPSHKFIVCHRQQMQRIRQSHVGMSDIVVG